PRGTPLPHGARTRHRWQLRIAPSPSGLPAALLNVAQSLSEQGQHVLVIECVVDLSTLPPRANDARVAEQPQLMRDGRFGGTELTREIADAHLAARERIENADARRIAKDAKNLGEVVDFARIHWMLNI